MMIKIIAALLLVLVQSKYETVILNGQMTVENEMIVEIHPRRHFITLRIERREGHPLFITNRCLQFQRKACIDEMPRLNQMSIVGRVELVELQYCANCIVLIKIITNKQQSNPNSFQILMSLGAQRHMVDNYVVDRMNKPSTIKYQCQPNQRGYLYVYSGNASIIGEQQVHPQYIHNTTDSVQVRCQSTCSYILSLQQDVLHDGLVTAAYVSPSHPISFNISKGYVLIATPNDQLKHLSIKVSQMHTQTQKESHIMIHPKYLMHVNGMHTQSLHLPSENQLHSGYHIQIASTINTSLIILPIINEVILLSIGMSSFPHSLNANESQIYISEGRRKGENMLITVKTCAKGQIIIYIGQDMMNMTQISMKTSLQVYIPWVMASNTLILNITTTNYAHYRIQINPNSNSNPASKIYGDNHKHYYYDTSVVSNLQQDNTLTLTFAGDKNARYYLISGNNVNAVMKEGYCPRNLFQMQSRLEDVTAMEIFPGEGTDTSTDTGIGTGTGTGTTLHLTIELQKHHHSYAVITAVYPDGSTFAYDPINLSDIKEYSNIRYPLYNVFLFITLAAIVSVSCVMGLKKRRTFKIGGYTALDAPSQDSL